MQSGDVPVTYSERLHSNMISDSSRVQTLGEDSALSPNGMQVIMERLNFLYLSV